MNLRAVGKKDKKGISLIYAPPIH
ncbi:MAG: hypothetical protein METHSR3v1_470012 [Methanothrix sp.]|nr:MAG: hypothetical protein METHSR3v1_470012 [Methanothrix sp.]